MSRDSIPLMGAENKQPKALKVPDPAIGLPDGD